MIGNKWTYLERNILYRQCGAISEGKRGTKVQAASFYRGGQFHYLPTKVHLVKDMVFPVLTYGCESWTTKKTQCQRIDAFEL